jgi:hypothetical protein
MALLSVIVSDRDLCDSVARPAKDDSPLVVDPNRVPSSTITFKGLKPVPGRYRKVMKPRGGVQILQVTLGCPTEIRRESPCGPRPPIVKQILGQPVRRVDRRAHADVTPGTAEARVRVLT